MKKLRSVNLGDPPDRLVSRRPDGVLVRKRLSVQHRRVCPAEAQEAYFKGGSVALVRWFRENHHLSLSEAVESMYRARGFDHKAKMDELGNLVR